MARAPKQARREFPLVQLLPNLLTVGAICAGMTAVRFAVHGDFGKAVALIVLAALLDGIDGRLARLLKSESEIGAELDSLADFLNFGVAPGLILYMWGLQDMRSEGWIAVLIYVAACVLRLARFNVLSRSETGKAASSEFFVGVPAPLGGLLVMLPIYVALLRPDWTHLPDMLTALYMIGVGLLMISKIQISSFKSTTVYAENIKFVVVGAVAAIAALLTYPWATLIIFDLAYIALIAFSWRAWRRRSGVKEG